MMVRLVDTIDGSTTRTHLVDITTHLDVIMNRLLDPAIHLVDITIRLLDPAIHLVDITIRRDVTMNSL